MGAQFCAVKILSRTYTLKRRAEQQADTRHRIVDAAVDLHGTVGPALTTVSMIAERAGVQRHTYYAHFPDERSLLMACSGRAMERDPLPDPAPLRHLSTPAERLTTGLHALYDWFERNDGLMACILRDAEHHSLVREVTDLRMEPVLSALHEVLAEGLPARRQALLTLALSFHTWRTLRREAGLSPAEAVDAMVRAVTTP